MSERSGDPAELLNRARALADAADYSAVERMLEDQSQEQLLAEPELGYHLAYAWRRAGRAGAALTLVQQLDVPVRRGAAEWLMRRRVNLEAMLRFDAGELNAAAQLWAQVVDLASAAADRQLLAAAHNNLGVVHTLRDQVQEALAAYGRALLASRNLGDRRGMAQAHQNLAIVYRELGRPDDADAHFEQALRQARMAGSEDVRGRVEEERALLLLDAGDAPLAAATAHLALQRFAAIGDRSGEGEARRVLGIIALRERQLITAREQLERALELALDIPNPLLEAETRVALALLDDLEGGAASARTHRELAEQRFAAMRAESWGRRINARTAGLAGIA